MGDKFNIDVINCARCCKNHDSLEFRAFHRPFHIEDGGYTHWGICPNTGEPILMQVTVLPEEEEKTDPVTLLEEGKIDLTPLPDGAIVYEKLGKAVYNPAAIDKIR